MDPDCAICGAPASFACECEAQRLELAISQAEKQMMQSIYDDIKTWVREHARDYILDYFALLKERRLKAHDQNMDRIKRLAYHYHTQPHPGEIQQAQMAFKRGIDEDWQSSVQRYPEVLGYYYSLVNLTLPSDDDPMVRDPPLSALSGTRKSGRRTAAPATVASGMESIGAPPPVPPPQRISMYGHPREIRGRTPPPPPASERMAPRTPVPIPRSAFRQPPPSYMPHY
ncbi:hypothetical protein SPBR_03843 [Sporothrix brasiliensis 5110]|uniref:Uncharacterized protein n=1 Tax=Sporothrix brasiliensis 5110 TaxID=1398154 RepID=A0A0C2FUT4_9PEZI|nr:uncharacterized protein SPBR_03843 [Sporothrix brasiliensis 5110]KIH94768.1 hypothetical protein SPBR_03843 [Sporothrix brasiliensis 5110]